MPMITEAEMASEGRRARVKQLLTDAIGAALVEYEDRLTYEEVLLALNDIMGRQLWHMVHA